MSAWIAWAYANWPVLLILVLVFGLTSAWLDRHPETADRWASRLYPEWRR